MHSPQIILIAIVALASLFLASLPLFFVGGVMLNVIDAAYSCIVLDLERRAGESRPELAYAVFYCMQTTGRLKDANIVISQPGGAGPVIAIATPVTNAPGAVANQGYGAPVAYPNQGYGAPVAYPNQGGYPSAMPVAQPYITPVAQPVAPPGVVTAYPAGTSMGGKI